MYTHIQTYWTSQQTIQQVRLVVYFGFYSEQKQIEFSNHIIILNVILQHNYSTDSL